MNKRYHVIHGDKRTTVSLPGNLAGLLAVKLGETPDTDAAHAAVRHWLQARLDTSQGRSRVSQWLQDEAVLEIADKKVSGKYLDHVTGISL